MVFSSSHQDGEITDNSRDHGKHQVPPSGIHQTSQNGNEAGQDGGTGSRPTRLEDYLAKENNMKRRSFSTSRHDRYENSNDNLRFSSNMRPSSSLVSLGRRAMEDWEMSTTRRNYRFSQDGFDLARSQPIIHGTSLKIGVEGARDFSPEKRQVYRAYNSREICSARPGGRYRPPSVTTGRRMEGPMMSRSDAKDLYDRTNKNGSLSPNSTTSTLSDRSMPSSSSSPSHQNNRYSRPRERDNRFSSGSTTRSTYRDFSACCEDARPRPVIPIHNLKMEGNFSREVSSKEHYQEQPYCRAQAQPRKEMIAPPSGHLENSTTYREHIDSCSKPERLRRSSRYDYSLKIPDKIDWL